MKRIILLLGVLFLPTLAAVGEHFRGGGGSGGGWGGGRSGGGFGGGHSAGRPVIINMSRPSSGGFDRNFPSQQSYEAVGRQPSYGRIQRGSSNNFRGTDIRSYSSPGLHAAVSIHHHPYSPGYVRKKLQKIGVKSEPSYITDRSEFIHTSRAHSTISFPRTGPDHLPLSAKAFSSRQFNDPAIRNHMALVEGPVWRSRIDGFNRTEFQHGRYYWHSGAGFNYCHYVDHWGYHWWGWYWGDHFFWNRYFGGRWWWYDYDFDRWCFWNEGFWWWQDPYHVGDLYCYDDDDYIPCNSAEDQVVVQGSNGAGFKSYTSPDGTRLIKVAAETQDAFLYDTADPPTFNPIYLASGVQSVEFSDTSHGRPLEIILKLNDGSFDVLDGQGIPYSPGVTDDGQNGQSEGSSPLPPSEGETAPSDSNTPVPIPGTGGN